MFPAQRREGPTSVGRTLPFKPLVPTMKTSRGDDDRTRSGLSRSNGRRQDPVECEADNVDVRTWRDRRLGRRASNVGGEIVSFAATSRAPSVETENSIRASFAKEWATGKIGKFEMDFISAAARSAETFRPQKAPSGSEAATKRKRRLSRRTFSCPPVSSGACRRNSAKATR